MDPDQTHRHSNNDSNNIIEIYDFPCTLETKDLMSIFSEYRNSGFYIKWVNDTHALGVFSDPTEAQQALNKDYFPCQVRPISRACRSCKHKTSQLTGEIFRQTIAVPMGTNCDQLLADLLVNSYEAEFIQTLLNKKQKNLSQNFNFTYKYIDDIMPFNNPKFMDNIVKIYQIELEIKATTESANSASYLDLHLSTNTYGASRGRKGRERGTSNTQCGRIRSSNASTRSFSLQILSSDDDNETQKRFPIPIYDGNDNGAAVFENVNGSSKFRYGHDQRMRKPVINMTSKEQLRQERGKSLDRRPTSSANHGNNKHMRSQSSCRSSRPATTGPYERNSVSLETRLERTQRIRRIGYRKLRELAESTKDPDSLLLEIVTPQSGFSDILNEKLKPELMVFIIDILVQAFKSAKKQTLLDLVSILTTTNFLLVNFSVFIMGIDVGEAQFESHELSSVIKNICSLTCTLLQYMQSNLPVLNILVDSVERLASRNAKCKEVIKKFCPEVMNTVNEMKEVRDCIQEKRIATEEKKFPKETCESMQPPDDFRSVNILPVLKDINFNEKPFLRVNKTKGNYEDVNHYLDVQFRLLREDYLHPLRQGIMSFRKNLEFGKRFHEMQDIRVYENVQILGPVCSEKGILHNIQFDTTKLRHINWESSQRLMYGSLLCLTNDGFGTIFFATVTNRSIEALLDGQIEVQFQDLQTISGYNSTDMFVMAETTAYFEAYRHVLKGLQEIQDDMPFQKHIVHCQPSTKPPKYILQRGAVLSFDFSTLILPKSKTRRNVPVLNTLKWPSAEELHVDESQYKALQMAITKEVAIIQGPPGTGKTFIGLKIVQLLLHNKDIWTTKKSMDPILVVCYTNHALDQFLSEISRYSNKLVRVGGRCSKEDLLQYTLQKYREEARADKSVSKIVHERKYDCKAKLEESRKKIESVSHKIRTTKMGILKLNELSPFILDNHIDALQLSGSKNGLDEWLGFSLEEEDFYSGSGVDEKEVERFTEIMDRWVNELLRGNSIPIMSVQEIKGVQFFWKLNLYERASVYKLLHNEFRKAATDMLNKKTKEFNDTVNKPRNTKTLEEIKNQIQEIAEQLNHCEHGIVQLDTLMTYLPTRLIKFVKRLQSQIPVRSEFLEWICLDGASSSIETIAACLEGKLKESENLEFFENEERHLDENDDFDFHFADMKSSKKEIELTNLSSASVSILSDSNVPVKQQQHKWVMQISRAKLKKALKETLNGEAMSEYESIQVVDIWALSLDERRRLYRSWVNSYISMQKKSTEEEIKTYSDLCSSYNEVLEAENIEIMTGADIIGMTTTGAAKNRGILQTIKPKIIVVEEAAEVLESHIVTALNPDCQHLILIGDHKQLRPTPTVYMLAKKYHLDISLFERMVNNKLNYTTLGLQHRMRPEISIVMKHIYPSLNDHPCVKTYENIQGIDCNVFFINHQQMETSHSESKSHSNMHEAKFVSRLCRYILQQGYKPQQINVLTPYTGQVLALKRTMPKSEFDGVKITSVDNFQGEENDIIILSLVRSNKEQITGFLKIDNRICVALSRARKGMYVIGNFDMLQSQSTLWQNIIETMKKQNNFAPSLTLRCQNHPLKATNVSSDLDFDAMPNGGCKEICSYKLPCGHKCEQFCHILDASHILYQCMKQCEKYCSVGHRCPKRCFQPCKECQTLVTKINPNCGHRNELPCHENILKWKCPQQCKCPLSCNHICENICYKCKENGTHLKCQKQCIKTLPCGHSVKAKCFQSSENIICMASCDAKLSCGHFCSGTCHACCQGRLHITCQEKCKRQLICGHTCDQFCRNGCPPCEKNCTAGCLHQLCSRKCKVICKLCNNVCKRRCMHQECSVKCSEVCQNSPCTESCPKVLQCNHDCAGFCNDLCPTFCKICNLDKISNNATTDVKDMKVIKLYGCEHEFESKALEKHIVYNYMSSPCLPVGTVVCPACSEVINRNDKYMDIVKWSRLRMDIIRKAVQENYKGLDGKKIRIMDVLISYRDVDQEAVKEITALVDDKESTPKNFCLAELQIVILKVVYSIFERMADSVLTQTKEEKSIGEELYRIREFILYISVQNNKHLQKEKRDCFSNQEIEDIKCELLRLTYHVNFLLLANNHESIKELLFKTYRDVLESLKKNMKVDERALHKLRTLASRFKWNMYEEKFKEIDTLFKKLEKMNSVWRYGTWIRCRKGHVFQNDEDKGRCPSCGVDIEIATHLKYKPPVPVPLFTNASVDRVHEWQGNLSQRKITTKEKRQMQKPDDEQKRIAKTQTMKHGAVSKHTANVSFSKDDSLVTGHAEKERQEHNNPSGPPDENVKSVAIEYCNEGHILMRNEMVCRWCNPGDNTSKEKDSATIPENVKNDVSTKHTNISKDGSWKSRDKLTTIRNVREVQGNENPQTSRNEAVQSPTLKWCSAGHIMMRNETTCRRCSKVEDARNKKDGALQDERNG